MKNLAFLLTLSPLLLAGAQAQGAQPQGTQIVQAEGQNLLQLLEGRSNLTTLRALVERAGLDETLAQSPAQNALVLFAPTNNAFALLPEAARERLANDPSLLQEILSNHLAAGIEGWASARSLAGDELSLREQRGAARVNGAIVLGGIQGQNGTLYIIDRVLLPQQIGRAQAPNTQPQSTQAQGATGSAATQQTPPPSQAPTPVQAAGGVSQTEQSAPTIAALLAQSEQFSLLSEALSRTGLDSILNTAGSYTLFAPTNEAFAKIPREQLQQILDNPEALTNLLNYHVVTRALTAQELSSIDQVASARGDLIGLQEQGGSLTVNGARVTQADVRASNGIVHVIDTVLAPNSGR